MATFTIRVPDGMHTQIKDAAAADERSLNGQIVWLLKLGLDMRATRPDPKGEGK